MSTDFENDQIQRRYEELEELIKRGVEPYPYTFDRTHQSRQILDTFRDDDPSGLADVAVAARGAGLWRVLPLFRHQLE